MGAVREVWRNVDMGLRGVRRRACLPRLTRKCILIWAKAHKQRTGKWPTCASGPILDAPGEAGLWIR